MNTEEFKKPINTTICFIDIGLYSKNDVLKVIDIGEQIIFEHKIGILNDNIYNLKASGNRIGCYV